MLFRRNLIITFFSLFVFSFMCFAQNTSFLDSLKGRYALQFQISDNFNLTNFQGTTFSGKYHFGFRSAVRVGLSVGLASSKSDNNQTNLDTLFNNSNINTDEFSITILSQYLHYIRGINDIEFFIGGGPFVGFNHRSGDSDQKTSVNEMHFKEKINGYTLGVNVIGGVEWIFSKNMSLSAEYGIMVSYYSTTRDYSDDNTKIKTTNDRFSIGYSDVNFGISVYF